jgi:hypothetical protein
MDIRKIAVVGGFAVAAALTSAPLASADDLTSTVDSEIASLNSIFESEASLAGDTAGVTTGGTGVLDTILPADAPDTAPLTTLDYELYGPLANLLVGIDNPISGASFLDSAPGAQDVLSGALAEFDDASNALAYLFINGEALIPTTDLVAPVDIATEEAGNITTETGLFASFFDTGVADLLSLVYVPFDTLD